MTPALDGLIRDRATPAASASLVCHVLLIETNTGLVLVDSGIGLADIARAKARLGAAFLHLVRPALREDETAYRRIQALGLDPADVRHIVLTHLDVDHAGGIADFPQATVHVLAHEHAAAHASKSLLEKTRYRDIQWAHGAHWSLYRGDGEAWHGFAAARGLKGLPPGILLIPLAGHTRGHAGVAVNTGDGWLLHAGDAYFHHGQLAAHPGCPVGLKIFQRLMSERDDTRRHNIERLRELARDDDADVAIFCAHDPAHLPGGADGIRHTGTGARA